MPLLDEIQLEQIRGCQANPWGPACTPPAATRDCAAIMACGDQLFARGNDPTISNETWLRQYKTLNDAYQRLPSLASCPPSKLE